MKRMLWLGVLLLASCGGPPATPCTMTWSGAVSGSGSCTGAASDALLAIATSSSGSLNWLVTAENDTHTASFQYQLPNPPDAMSYTGGTTDTQYCIVSLTPKATGSGHQAISRPNVSTGSPARGSCRITFTSKTDTSSKSTTRYTVHGTANATLQLATDASVTADMVVSF